MTSIVMLLVKNGDTDHGGICFSLYFVYTCSLSDRGKRCHRSRVMANYRVKFVYALVFKLGYPLKFLCESSITFLLAQGVKTGVGCTLWIKGCSRV